jgi:hypothetical protein
MLINAIDLLKTDVREAGTTVVDWQTLLSHVMTLLPTEGDASEEGLDLLDDSVAAVAYAIRTKLTGSGQEAAWSARRCYEYFDRAANEDFTSLDVNEPTDERLLTHPKVQNELKRQCDLLEVVQRSETANNPSAVVDEAVVGDG